MSPRATKVLVIAGCWTAFLLVGNVEAYLLIDDLIRLGTLSGSYAFWPDFAGNAVIGVFGGLFVGSLLVFKVNPGYRHRTFTSGIVRSSALFTAVYLVTVVIIVFALAFAVGWAQNDFSEGVRRGWGNVVFNINTPSFVANAGLWALLVSGTQFMLQVSDKFGPGNLWRFLTGRYYHPREEERVFMFLDLRSSTAIAEKLGPRRFFEMLRDLYADITRPVMESAGEIYQYVGDEVVVTWPVAYGTRDHNCILCFQRIGKAIEGRRGHYVERYDLVPAFKAGVHVGVATVGEIGVVKKDIVFSGDVLNTTSRIQEECNRHQVDLLASADLLARMPASPPYRSVPIGQIPLRGRKAAVELSTIAPY